MLEVTVTIKRKDTRGPQIVMSMEEYIDFIKEQSQVLNIEKQYKPLTRNLEKTHPGLKDPGPYPTGTKFNPEIKGVHVGLDLGQPGGDSSTESIAKELGKKINEAMNVANKRI